MSARKHVPASSNITTLKSASLRRRPVCQAIALLLAASGSVNVSAGIVNLGQVAVQMNAARQANAAGTNGMPTLGVSPQQAQRASQPSIQNLGRAAHSIAQQIAAQQAAAAAAGASSVPNGLTVGGLQVASGVSTTDTANPLLWYNAALPTQTVNGSGHVTVNVVQKAQNAVLTWQTMNVGQQTTLNFDQSAGTQSNGANNWVVLNRINDPSGKPSQILGQVNAPGAVYVINRNGILFGAGSQVNVHSLVASSLDLLNTTDFQTGRKPAAGNLVQGPSDIVASNQLFLSLPAGTTGGLAPLEAGSTNNTNANVPNEVLGLGNQVKVTSASQIQVPGDVTIAPGASIVTHINGNASDGGFVMIAAPNVSNGGSITATSGQVILAAGVGVALTPNPNNPQVLNPELSGQIILPVDDAHSLDLTPVGTLTNTGLVQAARGTINLLGGRVLQNGVVGVTTSVNTPGSIILSTVDEYYANTPTGGVYAGNYLINSVNSQYDTHRAGLLSFGADSVTMILPDTDGQTATSAPGTTFTPGSIGMSSGSTWLQSGSLIEAPGSNVSVAALSPGFAGDSTPAGDKAVAGRIYVDDGASIDVSGLAGVELPMSQTLLTIPRIGQNELANSPLLRNGFLFGLKNIVVDSTLSGTNSDGLQWVGSPILNLSGYVSLIPRTVDQLLTNGGSITLSGNEVMTAAGSSLNLNGGYVQYDGGMVNTTRLIDASGAMVPIGKANPNDTFVGIAGEFVESHPRWQVTKTWYTPLLGGGVYQPGYIVGGNAGSLNLFASSALVLNGDISAQAFSGSRQVQNNSQPLGGSFTLGNNAVLTQGLTTIANGERGLVILQDSAPTLGSLASNFSIDTPLDTIALGALSSDDPNNVLKTMVVPVDTLNAGAFAKLSIIENSTGSAGVLVSEGTQLTLQPGGAINIKSPNADVTVLGSLVAPSGTISISSGSTLGSSNGVALIANGGITVGPNALISAAGLWVNNDTNTAPGTTPGSSEFINGGSISLSNAGAGNIALQPGSVLDVSSGGELLANGQMLMQNGIPVGKGGNITLVTNADIATRYQNGGGNGPSGPIAAPLSPLINMDGTIKGFGFAGGGTLTLGDLGFQLGGDPAQAPTWDEYLPADFFARQGFGKYVLNAWYDVNVMPGTTVSVTQQNLMPNVPALQQAVTGAAITANGLTTLGTLDAYHRQATSLVMTGGSYMVGGGVAPGATGAVTVDEGAAIIADAGASIGLGSPTQVTVLGSIIAPGGAITLSADSHAGDYALPGQANSGADAGFSGYTAAGKSLWLGSNAVLDVSGTALVNPLAAPVVEGSQTIIPHTGKVLSGGSVILSDDSGYVVAQAGSVINVSGASATFDTLQSSGQYAPQAVWSDAGAITLAASNGLLFDGTLQAQPGASLAQGGSLTLLPQLLGRNNTVPSNVLVLQQSGQWVPAGLAPGQDIVDTFGAPSQDSSGNPVNVPTGVLNFSVDRLAGSGISTLTLEGSDSYGAPAPVVFAGNVDLSLARSIRLNTDRIVALSPEQAAKFQQAAASGAGYTVDNLLALLQSETTLPTPTAVGSTVTLDAPYVAMVGPRLNPQAPAPSYIPAVANSILNVDASFIDLQNQFQLNNFGEANLTSRGDIRLSSTNVSVNGSNTMAPGQLYTPGNLTLRAADLYPATGSTFILDAVGPNNADGKAVPTTITFLSNGASGAPLSAGGTLLVDATNIVQAGTVRAPSGSLIFGVGDANDAATQKQFNGLPLVATQAVTLADGSITSVSNGGAIIPYGTTVDGVEWQFDPMVGGTLPDVTAPPSKFIGINGNSVALHAGATVDLSGGGNLQAVEWVPGTGGSRDLLSQYNVSYATTAAGTAVPVNVGATDVYAIVPGVQSPVAAYDPVFAQTLQPSVNANGTSGTTTLTSGVGQASLTSAVGQSVYLSGVPGLPAGTYTLLPAKYATLPGAYRVTLSSVSGAVAPGTSQTLPDGTVVAAGYMADALSGARSATPLLFNLQSAPVWQQYSQYTLSNANSFFPKLAATAGHIAPPLPLDGGQLVLAATQALTLGASLNTTAATGGAPAEVDIASQDIQITGSDASSQALPGYLQVSAAELDTLQAGSLLIGGTRSATANGIVIHAIANSVLVSNDAADPLTGPEILLVTKTDPDGTDPNAANGLRLDQGSVINVSGSYPAAKDVPIIIGQLADGTTGAAAISGDGALLRVSNGAQVAVKRYDASGTGLLTVDAGASIRGGQALMLDSSGNLLADPSATLSAQSIAADGSAITFTDQSGAVANLPGFVIGAATLAQFANAQQITLRSTGAINFVGDVDATFGNQVTLSAGSFHSDGGAVTLAAQQVAFTNDDGAPVPVGEVGNGTLTVNAKEIDFGAGDKTLSGFGAVTMNASSGIVGQGTGSFDFGALPVTLNAPVYLADTSAASTIKTTGALNIHAAPGTALSYAPAGGAWQFIGGMIDDNGVIDAPAGNVSLEATTGGLTIGSGATVSSAGTAKQFYDVTQYAPAGTISLTADAGAVNVLQGSVLDFSGAAQGGAAGSLVLSSPQQVVNLAGTLKGDTASGFAGGSFSLQTGGAANLDNLAATLASSGVNSAISIVTGAGNLTLSQGHTLTAHAVSLIADGGAGQQVDQGNGNVSILGTINASGMAGGKIELYGKNGVDVEGTLRALASMDGGATLTPNQRGGTVNIGTSAVFDPATLDASTTPYDATYGYEILSGAQDAQGHYLHTGTITLGANAIIDVRGGTAGGLSGGSVNFRAPLLGNGDVPVIVQGGAQIKGSRSTTLEAYAVWSTTDATTGASHFDGIVDPAGWYTDSVAGGGQPGMVDGTWTDQQGNALPNPTADQLAGYLANDYFTPSTGAVNTDHQMFYGGQTLTNSDGSTTIVPGTLMGFVQNLPVNANVATRFAGIDHFAVVPGIELDNPTPATGAASINNGNISVLTNWNLGAGSSPQNLVYRFNGHAPEITFRAAHDVQVDASLTDGFFQIANPVGTGKTEPVPPPSSYSAVEALWNGYFTNSLGNSYYTFAKYAAIGYYGLYAPYHWTSGDPAEIAQYYGFYDDYLEYLTGVTGAKGNYGITYYSGNLQMMQFGHAHSPVQPGQPTLQVSAPTAAEEAANPAAYLLYFAAYKQYMSDVVQWQNSNLYLAHVDAIQAPPAVLVPVITTPTVTISPAAIDNSPSPEPMMGNGLPLLTASLNSGSSTAFRLVAGANLSSADPLSLQSTASLAANVGGSFSVNGHFAFTDTNAAQLLAPTMIRTGTGSIDIAAGNNIQWLDTVAPGVIYSAGAPASGAPATGIASAVVAGDLTHGLPDLLVTPSVNPDSAGDISLHAQGDITGIQNVVDQSGAITGEANANISQYWWQWMEITAAPTSSANAATGAYTITPLTRTSIDFGAFDQGVMSVGGNVAVNAGGTISDLGVSLPTTWYLDSHNTPITVGGGNLSVQAGGDILSGSYFVAKGVGTLSAGGLIGADVIQPPPYTGAAPIPQATLLAAQDGIFNVSARQGVDIGGVFDPSYLTDIAYAYKQYADGQAYSPTSAVNVSSTTGDIQFGSFPGPLGVNRADLSTWLPASLNLTAFSGGINMDSALTLYPSAIGQLNLIADQTVRFSGAGAFAMSDADPASMPSPMQPQSVPTTHATHALHASDTAPARIYSLQGSIVDGIFETSGGNTGLYDKLVSVVLDKPALIQSGQDIVNLAFQGQNLRSSDITRIVAGRDIYDSTALTAPGIYNLAIPSLVIGGPGTFDVEAGRNIGPLTPAGMPADTGGVALSGIDAVGNANNPNLPHESANIQVLFGVGPGIDDVSFIAKYIDPSSTAEGVPSTTPALIAFMEQYDAGLGIDTGLAQDKLAAQNKVGNLTAAQAWAQFQALPTYVQRLFVEQVLFGVLTDVGNDYNNPDSPYFGQYARGYRAINTLFPATLGYTANDLGGGANGANATVDTGDLDLRKTTIQTQQGGNISLLGPGGQALIGSTSAPPELLNNLGQVVAGPGSMGILTLEQGDINIFTDRSVLLAQSRIFTEQGGAMTIWSSNGDINAGKGAKSSADIPPPNYVCDVNHYCIVDARGEVTGAGIAVLQTIPSAPASNADLIAPRGTVDAGDAGIRVSGNLNVAALHVANADNIQVQGKATGIPTVQAVNTGALTAASAAASAASQMAQDLAKKGASGSGQRHWTITVDVMGFGDGENRSDDNTKRKHKPLPKTYNGSQSVTILGFGGIGQTQRSVLSKNELNKLGDL